MFSFHIQPDSEIPASQQLLDQLQFAIASHQFRHDQRLPSLRQLEMITGLHRNTISKIYHKLELLGLVKSVPGSGIYVQDNLQLPAPCSQPNHQSSQPQIIFDQAINQLLEQGYSLPQIRHLFSRAIDWRVECAAQVIITVPQRELGAGQWMLQEIEQVIAIPIRLVPLETLAETLTQVTAATIVTTTYFVQAVTAVVSPQNFQIMPVTLHDYGPELAQIKALLPNHHLGLVSFSPGVLHAASTIIQSLRGSDIHLTISTPDDLPRLRYLIHRSETILCDSLSYEIIKKQLDKLHSILIHQPKVILCKNYISQTSLELLEQTFGIH
ncbi:GntR family transcriptional regulator [Picosynechococcus sp. PCC 73109]|uniref:GntR family transcriptional regulator n=1 Tax=Picosynechococcus sp. PCC 73109 TaxID=374982 RepID=UPI00074583B4|nr:GntR family transcriptional regulator [Picosynechococcus sp. PCC 73109]AMA08565.1 hypothetical protein AWQ23_04110 [Picosynechococcus sp. PCC 73109]